MKKEKQDIFFSKIGGMTGPAFAEKLRYNFENYFRGINLGGKRVLEIGSGNGLRALYAADNGASEVICLEPESDGNSNILQEFFGFKKGLGINNIILRTIKFQKFRSDNRVFDIIILYNTINHLDEEACVSLREDHESRNRYKEIFRKLRNILKDNGILLISDCSSRNFFSLINMKNPFVPSIEWKKHQTPEVWARLGTEAGLLKINLNWSSPSRFGKIGNTILSNRFASYFFSSHFHLKFKKASDYSIDITERDICDAENE